MYSKTIPASMNGQGGQPLRPSWLRENYLAGTPVPSSCDHQEHGMAIGALLMNYTEMNNILLANERTLSDKYMTFLLPRYLRCCV